MIAVTAVVAALAGAGIAGSISATRTGVTPKPAHSPAAPTPAVSPPAPGAAGVIPGSQPQASSVVDVPPPGMLLDLPPAKIAVNMGNWSYDHKDFAPAVVYYREAIRRGFDNPDIRTDLGNAYRFTGDLRTALTQYEIAQKQSPKHENSLFNQGACYLSLGDAKKAVATWQDYLARFPSGEHRTSAEELIAEAQGGAQPTGPTIHP